MECKPDFLKKWRIDNLNQPKMKIKTYSIVILILICSGLKAQIKNSKIEIVKISGNCDMCKNTIEKAGNKKKVSKVIWNSDSNEATITFDTLKTSEDEILKRIALAGYDNDKFLAPDDAYASLNACCQYERNKKTVSKKTEIKKDKEHEHPTIVKQPQNSLKLVIDAYFQLKDALVKTDSKGAALKAKEMLNAVNSVIMDDLKHEEHTVWMTKMKDLIVETEQISQMSDSEKQRKVFMALSNNMYELLKVSKYSVPVYYQNCPMYNDGKGANWLSKDRAIKNPYFGSQMMSCGKTIETIK